jgi:hypothetical protein
MHDINSGKEIRLIAASAPVVWRYRWTFRLCRPAVWLKSQVIRL